MEDTRSMTQGKRILYYRKRLGLTQDQLAEKMGVSPQAVSKWERDLSCPDITTLPRLAEIFGITTDELLGVATPEPETVVREGEPEPRLKREERTPWTWSWNLGRGKWQTLVGALSLLALGGLYLAALILKWEVTFWQLLWPLSLVYVGLLCIRTSGSFVFGSATVLGGLYLLLGNLDVFSMKVTWPMVLGGVLVLWGIGVLASLFRKPKAGKSNKRSYSVYIDDKQERPTRRYRESGGAIHADYAFCSDRIQVKEQEFRGGDVEVAFGSLVLDLQACETVAPDCELRVEVSFGSLLLILPPHIRAEVSGERAGGALDVTGQSQPEAQVLRLDGDFAFSAVKIKYMEW